MDGSNFDALARTLAHGGTRRGFLRKVAGAAALVAAGRPLATAAAACPLGQAPARTGCVCKNTGRPPGPAGCGCGVGQTDCGGTCKDLSSDFTNCGACGAICPSPEQICRGGQCLCPPERPDLCGTRCVNLQTDPDNCGACDTVCPGPTPGTCQNERICAAGTCTFTPLPIGTECRPSAGVCDLAENCDGQRLDCPPDIFLVSDIPCRPAVGDCDEPEYCTGAGPDCPPDLLKGPDTVCRPGAGVCNPEERCNGTSPTCPPDTNLGPECGGSCCSSGQTCVVSPSSSNGVACGVGGGLGQPCRVADGCDAGLLCEATTGTCLPCGGVSQLCCPDPASGNRVACGAGLLCVFNPSDANAGTCQPCGQAGGPCCIGPDNRSSLCNGELVCQVGTRFCIPPELIPCVTPPFGPPVCFQIPGNVVCGDGEVSALFGICKQCGEDGGPCCGDTCNPGMQCVQSPSGAKTCHTCGAEGDNCCPPSTPGGTLSCAAGNTCFPDAQGGVCRACGGPDEPCCFTFAGSSSPPSAACDSGYACQRSALNPGGLLTDSVCRPCGGPNQLCCDSGNVMEFGGDCESGLTCSLVTPTRLPGTCLAPDACGGSGQPCCGLPDNENLIPGICDAGFTCAVEGQNFVCR